MPERRGAYSATRCRIEALLLPRSRKIRRTLENFPIVTTAFVPHRGSRLLTLGKVHASEGRARSGA
jgi:hypothetical protein